MTEREALKLALEALEVATTPLAKDRQEVLRAIAAIKEALREHAMYEVQRLGQEIQPEQEPVAWMSPSWIDPDTRGWQSDSFESIPIEGWLPLYTTPPQGIYYTSPQRTWVGLTDDEIDQGLLRSDYAFKTAEAWRAGVVFAMTKLKEKNT